MFYSSAFCVVILISVASSVTRQQSAPLTSSDLVIAGLQYGSDTAAVRAQLGLPRRATVRDWKYSGLGVQLDSGHVTMLHLTSSRWQTQRGIRVGSSLAAVHHAYGQPSWSNSEQVGYILQPDTSMLHRGLSFEITKGRVSYILSGIVSVTVH